MSDKHPGATDVEILHEPDWTTTPSHRVGLRNRDGRFVGLTHAGDDGQHELAELAQEKIDELRKKAERGELLSVRDVMNQQEDFHLRRTNVHPKSWRYVLHTTESFIKEEQPWPVNAKKWEEEEKKKQKEREKQQQQQQQQQRQEQGGDDRQEEEGEENDSKNQCYTAEQRTLLQSLQKELARVESFQNNDGKGSSPVRHISLPEAIDEADQFSPDSWIPRSEHLIRLTGKHPLNAECDLTRLFDAGLVTPNPLHYVRSHGAVPHLLWENHQLEVTAGDKSVTFLMDDLVEQFASINIPILMACDGYRRKELNMIRRSKGFNFTGAAASCAYWKGVLLREVLLAAEVSKLIDDRGPEARLHVNFEGADRLSQGKYATSIALEYAMDPSNDVLLAYEMNDQPLPPDHGYPLRVMIPGYVGGRSVKWLERIWISDRENDSYYHVYDNRVLPGFITDAESEVAQLMFRHPSTVCNEQNLNSVIVKPRQGEKVNLGDVKKGKTYRIEGYAFNGGGNEVQRVEVSLDAGMTWAYGVRRFPEAPLQHGRKFWTWLHWHVDVDMTRLIRAESITVRCFDVNKNTQPEAAVWNLEGMMNNCWYVVKPEVVEADNEEELFLTFRHPCEAGNGTNGWMKPSTEDQIDEIKRQAAAPEKQFTREEIEKHHTEQDCWIVVGGKVYDATSVLSWHPGGKAAILTHAGRVHDDFAQGKLKECILGVVTKRTMDFMKKESEDKAKQRSQSMKKQDPSIALDQHKWVQAKLIRKTAISSDTHRFTFSFGGPARKLGLETCQHVQVGFHFSDRLVVRPYTPIRPVLDSKDDDDGTFDLAVKTYYPDANQPGGTLSNILDCLRDGEEIEVKGPSGGIRYRGNGRFAIDEKEYTFDKVTLILGGSGITPGYQLIARVLLQSREGKGKDRTQIKVIDANTSEKDILLRDDFDRWVKEHGDQFAVTHVLSRPGKDWNGLKGHVDETIIKENAFEPDRRNVALLCGPPTLIQKAVVPVLKEWGYRDDENLFGF